jgi:hypothetical protein
MCPVPVPVLCRSPSRSGGRRNFLRRSSRRIVTDKGGVIVATLGGETNLHRRFGQRRHFAAGARLPNKRGASQLKQLASSWPWTFGNDLHTRLASMISMASTYKKGPALSGSLGSYHLATLSFGSAFSTLLSPPIVEAHERTFRPTSSTALGRER